MTDYKDIVDKVVESYKLEAKEEAIQELSTQLLSSIRENTSPLTKEESELIAKIVSSIETIAINENRDYEVDPEKIIGHLTSIALAICSRKEVG